ncbi:hypothetical protein [Reyranella sp.]|jgi:hypothetical protein|uniref:hypothetical protein n=1 Tax=Reyranella sp. TaxID=1929291 RepID=UPI002F944BF1
MLVVRRSLAVAGAIAALLAPALSAAEETGTAAWGTVGGWQIRVDRSIGNGCFAAQGYTDGTVVRLGFDMNRRVIYLVFGKEAWRSIEPGKLYHVDFVFDGVARYGGDLRGVRLGGNVFLDADNLSVAFTRDFMERTELRVYYRGVLINHLSLRNTYAAIGEVIHCQQEIAGSGDGGAGAAPYRNAGDPFRR